jgi:hypothetical protein
VGIEVRMGKTGEVGLSVDIHRVKHVDGIHEVLLRSLDSHGE